MIRLSAAIIAFAGFASLSACGAGGSEFATKATAACIKDQGEAAAAKCGCQARLIEQALRESNGNKAAAARVLEISYKALLYKVREFGLEP